LQKVYGAKKEDYDSYAEKVKPVILCGADGRVQSIALKYLSPSTLDTNVMLDEDHWAVTLASSDSYMSVGYCGHKGINHGHGIIAYEGIENGRQFLKFAHITTRDRVRGVPDPGRDAATQARVEIFDERPASLRQGPTWRRTRCSVEAMLRPIQAAEGNSTYVKFGASSDIIQRVTKAYFCGFFMIFLSSSRAYKAGVMDAIVGGMSTNCRAEALKLGFITHDTLVTHDPLSEVLRIYGESMGATNCISWSLDQLPNAGIRAIVPVTEVTPHAVVNYLRLHPEASELRS